MEKEKKENHLSKIRDNILSTIWNISKKEEKALDKFADKIRGYRPRHGTQESVISFALRQPMYYKILAKTTNPSASEVNKYIDASQYWHKNDVTLSVLDELSAIGNKVKQKIVFAENKEMKCVIFNIDEYIYISTMSSFENYLDLLEGKQIKKKEEEPDDVELMQKMIEDFNNPTQMSEEEHQMEQEQREEYQRNLL